MNSRAQGFTMVEVTIVAALSAVVMGAIYQTLLVQQKSIRQIDGVVATQQTLRTSMKFLTSEFRELGTTTGDIQAAAPESVTFRALRKMGIVCGKPGETSMDVYSIGSAFTMGDSVLMFADLAGKGAVDDSVRVGVVSSAPGTSACTLPTGAPWSNMTMATARLPVTVVGSGRLADISNGAIVRSYEKVTYGIFLKGGRYVLGRRGGASTDTVITVIGPLAPPAQSGFRLEYFDTANNALSGGNLSAADRLIIGRIRMTLRSTTPGAGSRRQPTYSDALVTNIYLRGNS